MRENAELHDIVIIGGGQMGLSLGYYLRRAGADFLILDAEDGPGGAWRHGWESLRLFSPAGYSSLPGWLMPPVSHEGYPTRADVLDYLSRYEQRYELPVRRPVRVEAVKQACEHLELVTSSGPIAAHHLVSATGTWSHPYLPDIPGRDLFKGIQVHSAQYVRPEDYAGQTVLVVGGGNSGAQIMAEVAPVARALWVTTHDPLFLPDDVDGRVLFERAVARMKAGPSETPVGGIGDIVMVPPVKEARARGDLVTVRSFERMTATGVFWPDGSEMAVDQGAAIVAGRIWRLDGTGVCHADGRRTNCARSGCAPGGSARTRRAESRLNIVSDQPDCRRSPDLVVETQRGRSSYLRWRCSLSCTLRCTWEARPFPKSSNG